MSRKKLIIIITVVLSLIITASAIFILQPNDTTEQDVKKEKTITFALFSDFHYKKLMYPTTVADMETIFDRANSANADLVLSAGDLATITQAHPKLPTLFLTTSTTYLHITFMATTS